MAKRQFINRPPSLSGPHKDAPKDAVKIEFARRLQATLIKKGWRQSDLARETVKYLPKGAKLGRDSISHYIRGKILPRALYLDAISKALGMPKDELVPTKGYSEAGDDNPPLDVRDLNDGNAWLKINQAVSWSTAVKILEILKGREDGTGGPVSGDRRNDGNNGDQGPHMAISA